MRPADEAQLSSVATGGTRITVTHYGKCAPGCSPAPRWPVTATAARGSRHAKGFALCDETRTRARLCVLVFTQIRLT